MLTWTETSESDDATTDERKALSGMAESMAEWGAGEASMIGRDDDGHIVAGYTVLKRPTEYLGLIYRYDEGRTDTLFVTAPLPTTCRYCGMDLRFDGGAWVDHTDGDVCSGNDNLDNENEPHVPMDDEVPAGRFGGNEDEDETTYKVIRFFQDGRSREVQERGLTLAEAQEHCNDPSTKGDGWFDGYEAE